MPGKRDQAQSGGAAARSPGADLTPFRAIAESVTAEGGELVDQVSALIDQAQAFAAAQVDATLTLRNWYIGRMIDVAVLREGRAGHDQELVASLGRQLTARYGRGFERANLYRMVQLPGVPRRRTCRLAGATSQRDPLQGPASRAQF